MGTKITDEVCGSVSVSGDWIYYYSDKLYKIRTDGTEKTAITDDFAIFTCVHGDWVYYCVKSETGGLWRVSIDGGKPEQVVPGFVMTYCIVDDWVYYVDLNNWQNICRVHTDGTSAEEFLSFGQRIITFNIADGIIYINFNVSNDEQDGFTVGSEISAIDMATLENLQYVQADSEPLCTGPEGMLYFFKFSEGMQWYSMNENGQIAKVGSGDNN